jgi:DNA-binding transcriptional ArsR family regulator
MSRSRSGAQEQLTEAALVFAALGDPTRLRVVARLCVHGPQSITRLSEGANVTRQAITKHLHALSNAGLVHGHSHGRERIWELETARLVIAHECLKQISTQWDAAIGRLKSLVEE